MGWRDENRDTNQSLPEQPGRYLQGRRHRKAFCKLSHSQGVPEIHSDTLSCGFQLQSSHRARNFAVCICSEGTKKPRIPQAIIADVQEKVSQPCNGHRSSLRENDREKTLRRYQMSAIHLTMQLEGSESSFENMIQDQ